MVRDAAQQLITSSLSRREFLNTQARISPDTSAIDPAVDLLIDKRGGGADASWHEKHVPAF